MQTANNNMGHTHLGDLIAGFAGFITMLMVDVPAIFYNPILHRLIVGLAFTAIYTVFGWFIRHKLDKWKKKREE